MKIFQLTIFVRDLRTNARRELSFVRSPVVIGRDVGDGVRLDARTVSRRHGEIRFGKGGLQYVDLGSSNGTYIDGIQIEPGVPIDVRSSSVIDIVPYQMLVQGELVPRRRRLTGARIDTAVNRMPRPQSPHAKWSATLANSASLQRLFIEHGPVPLFRRATAALEVVAALVLAAILPVRLPESPLSSFTSSAELVAHLIDPAGEEQRLDDLRDLLAALLQPTATTSPEGLS